MLGIVKVSLLLQPVDVAMMPMIVRMLELFKYGPGLPLCLT